MIALKHVSKSFDNGRTLAVNDVEVLGAVGLLVGYFVPVLMIAASGGLALLMALGVATRIRVGDRFIEMLPAAILLLVNVYLLSHAVNLVRAA